MSHPNDAPRTRAFELTSDAHMALMILAVAAEDGREVRVGRINSWPYSRPRAYRDGFQPVVHANSARRLIDRGLARISAPYGLQQEDDRAVIAATDEGLRWATERTDHG